jgi:hypothetical protein
MSSVDPELFFPDLILFVLIRKKKICAKVLYLAFRLSLLASLSWQCTEANAERNSLLSSLLGDFSSLLLFSKFALVSSF